MISWPVAVLTVLAVGLLALSPVAATVMLGGCVLAALVGPGWALRALMVATLITYANPAILKLTPAAAVLNRVVLVAVILRMLPLLRGRDLRLVWPIWLFGSLSALTSMQTSPALAISIMKIVTFTLATTAVLVAFGHVSAERLPRLQSWFLTVGLSIITLSALTLAKPSIGIGGDGGLQGVLSQPQALGIFIAPFAAWSVTGVMLMRRQASRLELWVAIGAVILIVLTRARTAAFATACAVGVVMLMRLLSHRRAQHASLGRPMLIVAVAAVLCLGFAVASPKVAKTLTSFAYKDYDGLHRGLGNAFYESRGGGVVTEWHNFLDSPWLGNGFGVYPDGKFPSGVVMFAGIPISAPIEKGFLPTAILEEGGIVGGAGLVLLIGWLSRRAWRAQDLRWRAMFAACLAVNIGECVFLSPGGIGILNWLLIGVCISACRAATVMPRARRVARHAVETAPELAPLGRLSLPASTR
jgi:hypothetical protein